MGCAMTSNDDEFLTVDDIYEHLNRKVPKDTIRSWIRSKRLPAYKPARSILVKRSDLEKFLRESRTTPDPNGTT
jgi:excisionase family DNA binding protein